MSDTDLRAAERALCAEPSSPELRLAYARAWDRAGRPLRRDPRRDPRPGDVVGGRLVVALKGENVAWEDADDRNRLWPVRIAGPGLDHGRAHDETAVRLPTAEGWRTGRGWTWLSLRSWRSWARKAQAWNGEPPLIRWLEPHDWGEWHLAPAHSRCRTCAGCRTHREGLRGTSYTLGELNAGTCWSCACRRCRAATETRMAQHARELA